MPIHRSLRATDLLALPERQAGQTLHRWLFDGLGAAIQTGRLPAGLKLPSTRALAAQMGLARGTVAAVYEELAAQGYLRCGVGRGSFVAALRPMSATAPKAPARQTAPADAAAASPPLRGAAWARSPFPLPGPPARPFRAHLPDVRLFPLGLWRQLAARSARALRADDLGEAHPAGLPLLREAIAAHLAAARGVSADPAQVLVVSSTQQALDLCLRLLTRPGDAVWLEDPGYPGTRALVAAAGLRGVPLPVDAAGLQVAVGQREAPRAALACVTPSRQAPLGVALSAPRRRALLDWAAAAGAYVVEDDYDSEIRYASRPIPALKAIDTDGRVVLLGTFSKLLFPGLRLAYAVLPPALVQPFVAARALLGRGLPALDQASTARFILDGHFERHLRRCRQRYAARAEALREAIARHARGLLEVPAIAGGLDVAVRLHAVGGDQAAQRRLADAGIETLALSLYRQAGRLAPGLVLGFAAHDEPEIAAAMRQLAAVLGGEPGARRGGWP